MSKSCGAVRSGVDRVSYPFREREADDPARRFMRLTSRIQDLTLLVLKGHLLIEEQLDYFLSKAARAPGELKDARLTYAQKLQLVHALTGSIGDLFDFAKAINKIRNDLAHHAEVHNLAVQIDNLLRRSNANAPRNPTPRQRATWLRAQVAFVCGGLIGIADAFHATHTGDDRGVDVFR